jgi:site-specific DNA-methyltransferase (adenine-specific)
MSSKDDLALVIANTQQAERLLASASTANQAKWISDLARALEVAARRMQVGQLKEAASRAIQYAHAIHVDALTLEGVYLKGQTPNKGAKGSRVTGTKRVPVKDETPTIAEQGISKKESAEAKALADVKAEVPQLHEQVRQGEISVRKATSEIRKKKKAQARKKQEQKLKATLPTSVGDRCQVEAADCLDWLRKQPRDSIHLVFGSPPYEDARLYLEDGQDLGITRNTGQWVAWMLEVYQAALACCTGLVAFVVEGRTRDYRWSASPCLLVAALRREGIALRKPPIYQRVGIPGSGGPDWLRNDYELIICATRGAELPWSENTAMGKPPVYEPGGNPTHRRQDGSRVNGEVGTASMQDRNNTGPHRARQQAGRVFQTPEIANPGNVIKCAVGGGNMGDPLCHQNEAPFPEYLAEFFIRSFCPPGGIVCDPFVGSGTTAKEALRLGRCFVGCDLRGSQVELSRRRVACVQPELFVEPSND